MNKRIGQLAEQAGLLGPSSRIGNAHDATERFAELIVRECALFASWCESEQIPNCSGHILRQFGLRDISP
jgi:hypothetical protein